MAAEKRCSRGDEVADQQVRRARWQTWGLAIAGPLLVIAVGLVLSTPGVAPPSPSGRAPPWREDLGLAVSAVGLLVAGVGICRSARAGMFSARDRAHPWSFARPQRREVVRRVRRGEAVPEEAAVVTTMTARSLARQRLAVPLHAGIALNILGGALGITIPGWWTLLTLCALAVMPIGTALVLRDARLARRWLDAHPRQTSAQAAGS